MINAQFRLLFAGQSVSVVGDALFPVALAFAVLDELDGTPAQLGIVLAAQTLPLAVLILAAGVWADRVNRRNVMIASDAGRAAAQAAPAALLITDTAELWHVAALGALYGVFDAGFQPAAAASCRRWPGASTWSRRTRCSGSPGTPAWSSAPRWPASSSRSRVPGPRSRSTPAPSS